MSQSQELAASVFGARSWHHLVARYGEPQCWVAPAVIGAATEPDKRWDSTTEYRFYRSVPESVWAFSQAVQHNPETLRLSFSIQPMSVGGVVLRAYGQDEQDPLDSFSWMSSYTPPVAYCDEHFQAMAQDITGDTTKIQERLAVGLGVGKSNRERIDQVNSRMGADGLLVVRNWVFSLHHKSHGPGETTLIAEEFNDQGDLIKVYSVNPVEMTFRHPPIRSLGFYNGFKDQPSIPLTGFTIDEVRAIAGFAGITARGV